MCDPKVRSSIVDVIGELTAKNLPFSAYDITKILRKRNVTVYHSDVKKEISQYYTDGLMSQNYFRVLAILLNGRLTWVYYPDNFNMEDYDENALPDALDITTNPYISKDGSATIVPAGIIVSNNNLIQTVDDYHVDGRGRLCIPANMIKALGYNTIYNQEAYVKKVNGKVYVGEPNHIDAGTVAFPYQIDKSSNVRISKYVLEYFGFNSTIFSLDFTNEGILITGKN